LRRRTSELGWRAKFRYLRWRRLEDGCMKLAAWRKAEVSLEGGRNLKIKVSISSPDHHPDM